MDTQAEISWSTERSEPAERIRAWQTVIFDAFQECEMEYEASADFWARMTCSRYGEVSIGRIQGSRRRASRTAERAKFGDDGVVMTIACKGRYRYDQARREAFIEPGEAYFFHNCLPGVFEADAGGDYWLIALPARVIIPGFGDSSSLVGCRITNAKAELKLLTSYLEAVYRTPGLRDPNTRSVIGSHVTDLIVATVGRADEASQASAGRGIRATRYKLAMEEIQRRHCEPTLNGERLARSLSVSKRYLQQLFEENGRTLSSEIMNERLKAVRRALSDPALDGLKISEIVYRCGFSDLSYFNRAFRRTYGETPKAARGLASGEQNDAGYC
jgi:AraC-like DNA-binding protein